MNIALALAVVASRVLALNADGDTSVPLGCFSLDPSINIQATYIGAMMPSLCVNKCANSAYALIAPKPGNIWSFTCLCQNQLPPTPGPSGACNLKCIGSPNLDEAPMCGGALQGNAIVWTAYQGKGTVVTPPTPPSVASPIHTIAETPPFVPTQAPQPDPSPEPLPVPEPQPEPQPQQPPPGSAVVPAPIPQTQPLTEAPQQVPPPNPPAVPQATIIPQPQGGIADANLRTSESPSTSASPATDAVTSTTNPTQSTTMSLLPVLTNVMRPMLPNATVSSAAPSQSIDALQALVVGIAVSLLLLVVLAMVLRWYCVKKGTTRKPEMTFIVPVAVSRSKSNASSAFRFGARSPQLGDLDNRPFRVLEDVVDESSLESNRRPNCSSPRPLSPFFDRPQQRTAQSMENPVPKPTASPSRSLERPVQRTSSLFQSLSRPDHLSPPTQSIETVDSLYPLFPQEFLSKIPTSLRGESIQIPPVAFQVNWNMEPLRLEPPPQPSSTPKPSKKLMSSRSNNRLPSWKTVRWTMQTDSGETATSVVDLDMPASEMDDSESVVSLEL
ncbi:UNVERIFIED_CONTAM: hypothetical protein HDU68_000225 [Siphonaria sp. JEL0065]|nr:hypothetical protein HDU68_000225 [Siphonaria sp. JEL0065]